MCLVEGDHLAADAPLESPHLAQGSNQTLGSSRSWKDSEIDLGKADLASFSPADAEVAGECDFQASTNTVPVEDCDRQLGRLFQAAESLVGMEAEVVLPLTGDLAEHADVSASAEETVATSAQQDHLGPVVKAGFKDRFIESSHHLVGVAVGRRIVDGDRSHRSLEAAADGVRHHRPSLSLFRRIHWESVALATILFSGRSAISGG